ncbi:MAG: DUF3352 domain-containing protein [Solirubrobacterales bacterium]|nr:DUF3352 domain-containing protein [Solirubrobacterales bacterium]
MEAAIYVAQGKAPSLADSPGYQRAAGGEPADRVLDAYASADGIRRALVPRSGLLGELGALLDQPSLSASALSASPAGGGLRIRIHSTFVAEPAQLAASRPVQFGPSLDEVLPAHSMLLLDAQNLQASAPKLLAIAARAGILGRLIPLLSRLGSALRGQGVDVDQVLGVFRGETALAIAPGRQGSGPEPVIVTRTSDEASTRAILANLEGPLSQVFTPTGDAPGVVPVISDTSLAGVPVHEVSLAPGFGLDYAVAHGLVVVSTGLAGVAGVLRHAATLGGSSNFQSVLGDRPSQVTSLVFFDLSQLLRLGERSGLIASAPQGVLGTAVERIHAVGLTSWRGANDTTTQVQLEIP